MSELNSYYLFNDANLVSYWRFEGNSNDSKSSNNGTDTSITYSVANGRYGQGAGFNGTTSKIVITDTAALKPTTAFSLSVWVKYTSNSQFIFQSYSQNTAVAGIVLQITGDNKPWLVTGKNTGTTFNVDYSEVISTYPIAEGLYHHVVAVWDGSNLRMYVDGISRATAVAWANAPVYAATNYIRVGCSNRTGTDADFYSGTVDELALFSRALSAAEINDFYKVYVNSNKLRPAIFTPGNAR